ncbi:Fe3+ hydroxamate ABC transporter substrate-binding protein [Bacillus haynesii]|uniref:Fe3+ hydroxamate ABC transporter substrate-binding protein n=1 Tax=Bacillus haynesii TaxID=1925021 RepID=UPI00115362FC|nr:Fe3+ hydroxamate ABC transporter substrate-binding protein [Bacillus haynesii]
MSHVTCKRCKKQISKDETFYYIDKPVGLSGFVHVKRFLESNGLILCEGCIREHLQK